MFFELKEQSFKRIIQVAKLKNQVEGFHEDLLKRASCSILYKRANNFERWSILHYNNRYLFVLNARALRDIYINL